MGGPAPSILMQESSDFDEYPLGRITLDLYRDVLRRRLLNEKGSEGRSRFERAVSSERLA
jgi:hypothetical protein